MSDVRYRAHVARLYPTPGQAALLDRQGHTARALWNLLHEWYTCRDGGSTRRPTGAALDRQLRQARTDPLPGWAWLASLPAQATQQVLGHYLRAWDRYHQGLAGRPRCKSKRDSRLAVDVPQASALKIVRVRRRWGEVSVPLVGRVRFRWTRALESRRSRGWFACVACGRTAPADTNAAQVLLARGLAARSGTAPGHGVAGRGAFAAGRAVKRQPPLAAART